VVVQPIGDGGVVAAGEQPLDALLELGVDREDVAERAVLRTRFLDDDLAVAPARIRARVSRTQTGQSESVVRGHPSGGALRSELLASGPDAHCGWNDPPRTRPLMT
jgi:hypothetical protein